MELSVDQFKQICLSKFPDASGEPTSNGSGWFWDMKNGVEVEILNGNWYISKSKTDFYVRCETLDEAYQEFSDIS